VQIHFFKINQISSKTLFGNKKEKFCAKRYKLAEMEDPFFVVKAEVESTLSTVNELFKNWKTMLSNTNTSTNDEFKWTTDELNKCLQTIDWDLQDLDETISIVESNPEKFKLDRRELKVRKDFVLQTKGTVEGIKQEMTNPSTKAKIEKDKREMLLRTSSKNDREARIDKAREMENQDFINKNSPQLLIQRQDEELQEVSKTVGRVKNIAVEIGNELDDQERLLDDVDAKVDRTGGKFKNAQKKLDKVYKSAKEKGSLAIIVILIIIAVVLAILIFTI